jgi:hypothetical protein
MKKKILIHQPYKYGDYLNVMPLVQKLYKLGYEVYYPYSSHVSDLIEYFDNIIFFEIGTEDLNSSKRFCEENNCILINCQSPKGYDELFTIHGGKYFIEEMKYYVAEDILKCGIKYEDKFNLKWNRNFEKENKLIELLSLNLTTDYNISHLVGDNGRRGNIPEKFLNQKTIEITKIPGFSLLDWYPIIVNSKNILTIQSSIQCYVDIIKKDIKHNNFYLLNDTSEYDRLLVPAYGWNMEYFNNKRLR